jgi:hypothetical protein
MKKNFYIWGYDWIHRDEYNARIKQVTLQTNEFLLFGHMLNKGTLHTVEMLASANNNEERAAIWLYAFFRDIDRFLNGGSRHAFAHVIQNEAYGYLSEHYYMWHHAMRKLTPNIYFHYGLFENIELKSFEPFVEIAMANAAMVLNDYTAVLYSSREDNFEPDSTHSLRRRT